MRRDRVPRVIVGVDSSLAGLRALRVAVAEARRRRAVLHAVRVWNFDPAWRGSPRGWYAQIEQEAADLLRRAFAEAMGGVPGDLEVITATPIGRPGRVLIDYAHGDDDLLVLGCDQRRWWRRLFRRSTAKYCASRAWCPVLVVPLDTFARTASREGLKRTVKRELPILSR
jgi:nucleotide-binding universal stress UspA family protein